MMNSKDNYQSESEFLSSYDAKEFDSPIMSVDTVIFTVFAGALRVLTLKRQAHPFKEQWALVGGFVDIHQDENLLATAKRKLFEKTGVQTPYLEQFGCIGNAARDPRGWSVSNIYFALIAHDEVTLTPRNSVEELKWSPIIYDGVDEPLAFDHNDILSKCLKRLRNKVLYTSLPVNLMFEAFTLRELQNVYETILNRSIEAKSFRRRLLSDDILEEVGEQAQERGRPAMLYKQKKQEPYFFLRSIEGDRK